LYYGNSTLKITFEFPNGETYTSAANKTAAYKNYSRQPLKKQGHQALRTGSEPFIFALLQYAGIVKTVRKKRIYLTAE
jgi:hypothetical protein